MPAAHLHRGNGRLDEREIAFLANFYGGDSPTKGNAFKSALTAGYAETTAADKAQRIIKRYEDCSFRASAKAVGITKPYLAMKLRQVLETGGEKEILSAVRLVLANMGEATDERSAGAANVFNAPVMVIVGASQDRIRALRAAEPQLTREEKEQIENERVQGKLEMLKRGELPLLPSKSRANRNEPQTEVLDLDANDAGGDRETQPSAG